MLETERQREERRERHAGEPINGSTSSVGGDSHYLSAIDTLISDAVSSNSEVFNQETEQENGQ